MLAVIAFQGTRLVHALHLAAEHAPPSGHGCAGGSCGHEHGGIEPANSSAEASPTLRDGQTSGHGHGHQHDRATCPVCQTLAGLKAVSAAPSAGLSASLSPALEVATPRSFPLPQIALSTLGPRAPPASA
jgi:hypothetical protein